MTEPEFQGWLKHHRARFTGLSKWIAAMPEYSESEPTRQEVLRGWYYALKDCDVQTAKDASDAIHRGEEAEPRGYDRHPAAIRAIANRKRDAESHQCYSDNQQTFRCHQCQDDGWVTVWHPISMKAAQTSKLGDPGTITTIAVACTCPAGDSHATARAKRFNPSSMVPLGGYRYSAEEQDKLTEFVGQSMVWQP